MQQKRCAVCNKKYMPVSGMSKYCSKECRKEGQKKLREDRKTKQPNSSIRDINKEAKEHGMSYGKYVVWLERGKKQ